MLKINKIFTISKWKTSAAMLKIGKIRTTNKCLTIASTRQSIRHVEQWVTKSSVKVTKLEPSMPQKNY